MLPGTGPTYGAMIVEGLAWGNGGSELKKPARVRRLGPGLRRNRRRRRALGEPRRTRCGPVCSPARKRPGWGRPGRPDRPPSAEAGSGVSSRPGPGGSLPGEGAGPVDEQHPQVAVAALADAAQVTALAAAGLARGEA